MTFLDDCLCGRSQLLLIEPIDKVVVDLKTIEKLRTALRCCIDNLAGARDCEIFLTSLDSYLTEGKEPSTRKSLLLLNHYRDVVLESLEEVATWLEEARGILDFILLATQLGGGNE
jgi:hypothetical protein